MWEKLVESLRLKVQKAEAQMIKDKENANVKSIVTLPDIKSKEELKKCQKKLGDTE